MSGALAFLFCMALALGVGWRWLRSLPRHPDRDLEIAEKWWRDHAERRDG